MRSSEELFPFNRWIVLTLTALFCAAVLWYVRDRRKPGGASAARLLAACAASAPFLLLCLASPIMEASHRLPLSYTWEASLDAAYWQAKRFAWSPLARPCFALAALVVVFASLAPRKSRPYTTALLLCANILLYCGGFYVWQLRRHQNALRPVQFTAPLPRLNVLTPAR